MYEVGVMHYLGFAAVMFITGIFGVLMNRSNFIGILMSIELILLSININFVTFSVFLNDISGQIFVMFILTIAAAEAAIGLAILILFYKKRASISVSSASVLKG